ncbi:MAG: hypothetical protein ACE5HO_04215 [bacterium]
MKRVAMVLSILYATFAINPTAWAQLLLEDFDYPAGEYSVVWDGKDNTGATVVSGPYLNERENAVVSRRMILLRWGQGSIWAFLADSPRS